jgi:hypothetical protein
VSEIGTVATAVFRLPRSAYIAVLFFAFGVTALVWHPILLTLYVFPLLAAVFIARRSTVIDQKTITVRAIFGSRVIAWDDVRGLIVNARDGVSAALSDGTALRLPYVRVRHLAVLSEITGGVVPAVPASPTAAD